MRSPGFPVGDDLVQHLQLLLHPGDEAVYDEVPDQGPDPLYVGGPEQPGYGGRGGLAQPRPRGRAGGEAVGAGGGQGVGQVVLGGSREQGIG